jgi:ketosteroid isomerase-like protein
MTFTGRIEDRLAIRELLETYADAVFRRDADAWIACWTEPARWEIGGKVIAGRDQLVPAWKAAMAPFAFADFQVQPGAIAVEGDRATVRSYTREFFRLDGGGMRHISGRYDDALIRTDLGWRFTERRYQLLSDEVVPAPG